MAMGPREMAIVNGRRLKAETAKRKALEAELAEVRSYALSLERDNDTLLGVIAGERQADAGAPAPQDRPAVMDLLDAADLERAASASTVEALVEEHVAACGRAPRARGAAPVARALFGAGGLSEGGLPMESGRDAANVLGAYGYMAFRLRDFLETKRLAYRGSAPYGSKGGRGFLLVTLEVVADSGAYVAGCDGALSSRRLDVSNVGHVIGVVTGDAEAVRRVEEGVGSGELSGEVLVTACDHVVPMAGKASTLRIVGDIAAREDLGTDRTGCLGGVGNDVGYYAERR